MPKTARNRGIDNALGGIGSILIGLLWLQALSLFTMTLLQLTIFNTKPTTKTEYPIEDALSSYLTALTITRPDEPNLLVNIITIVLWILLIAVATILAIYAAKIASSIIKNITLNFYGRITLYTLLITKIVLILVAFATIAFSALILPAVEYILLLNLIFAGVSIAAFLLQHWLAKRHKTPIKQLL